MKSRARSALPNTKGSSALVFCLFIISGQRWSSRTSGYDRIYFYGNFIPPVAIIFRLCRVSLLSIALEIGLERGIRYSAAHVYLTRITRRLMNRVQLYIAMYLGHAPCSNDANENETFGISVRRSLDCTLGCWMRFEQPRRDYFETHRKRSHGEERE